jgi:NTE family protein
LWLVTPDHFEPTKRLVGKQHVETPELSKKQRWIWVLEPDQPVAPFISGLSEFVDRDFKLPFSQTNVAAAARQRQGLHRIIHDLRDIRIGLAMGGGAARRMAHLGVLQALDAAGLVIDEISGTSVGAMVGCMYASGMSPELTAEYFARDLTPSRFELALPKGKDLYLVRKYRRNEWDGMLRKYLQDSQFEQLVTPMNTVTVDLVSASQVVRTGGDVVNAILESINLPGLSVPICRDGMALVDGGVLNVLPADVLVNAGADYVIGVNVSAQMIPEFAGNRPDTPTKKMKTPNAFETGVRMLMVQQKNISKIGAQPADFTITPDVSDIDLSDFQHSVEIAEVGKVAAEVSLSELKTELESLDACLTLK